MLARLVSAPATDLLTCPRCREALRVALESTTPIECQRCGSLYPRVGGIPVLLEDPQAAVAKWSAQLAAFADEMDQAAQHVAVQLVEAQPIELTRTRLSTVVESLPKHKRQILELFAAAGVTPEKQPKEIEGSILAYYALIHRDWGWEPDVDEVTPSVEAIAKILPDDFRLGTTLVLGAGTARLAWELGQRLPAPGPLLALDINPLPFLVTQRLLHGDTVRLFELPGHPRRAGVASIERELAAVRPAPKGLRLLFADGLNPPVRRGSFDTVITPWFVDQVPEDLAVLPALIHELLRPSGSWINHGPFVYDPLRTKVVHRYCADEFLQIVSRAGFDVTAAKYAAVPYLASPVSSQSRSESVLSMHARKVRPIAEHAAPDPEWLHPERGDLAIPKLDGLEHYPAPHPVVVAVAALIDGQRSVSDISRRLVRDGALADDGAADVAVRGCLKVLWKALANAQLRKTQ